MHEGRHAPVRVHGLQVGGCVRVPGSDGEVHACAKGAAMLVFELGEDAGCDGGGGVGGVVEG